VVSELGYTRTTEGGRRGIGVLRQAQDERNQDEESESEGWDKLGNDAQSPRMSASFFTRHHPLIWRSARNASSRVWKARSRPNRPGAAQTCSHRTRRTGGLPVAALDPRYGLCSKSRRSSEGGRQRNLAREAS